MGSVTPRASGFWEDTGRMGYFNDDEDDPETGGLLAREIVEEGDGKTSLDRTIDRIGMGTYQWTLLSLCGFGWMADNMWIQAVAIILPRVQVHYNVPDSYIGTVSSSMFAGMMFGAVGWGTCSDLLGRITAFNLTLFFTSLFGILAAFANSFPVLCVLLFLLGSSVGGSMPTDGTLLLENIPKGKEYLVTALSVFFSFGSVLSAVVALVVLPTHSCPEAVATKMAAVTCDANTENQGWKYLLIVLGLITLTMFLARIVFFTLHESPRYLVHAGRHQEAVEALQLIAQFNGSELSLDLEDVVDHHPEGQQQTQKPTTSAAVAGAGAGDERPGMHHQSSSAQLRGASNGGVDYQSTTHTNPNSPPTTPIITAFDDVHEQPSDLVFTSSPVASTTTLINKTEDVVDETDRPITARPRPQRQRPQSARLAASSRRISSASAASFGKRRRRCCGALPRVVRRPLEAWAERVATVLSPEWFRTTVLVWGAWFGLSLSYTMFNVYLPKLLEHGAIGAPIRTLEESLWDVVIFTIGGCPGALLGAYLIESPLGRRWSLAGSTFVTAFFCVVFVLVESAAAVRASTVGISLSATAMWAVLYGWTPEIFGTKIRGTACGIASALSRVGGMIAPMLGGMLLSIDRSVPVYTSVVVFVLAGICVLGLKEDAGDGGRPTNGRREIVH